MTDSADTLRRLSDRLSTQELPVITGSRLAFVLTKTRSTAARYGIALALTAVCAVVTIAAGGWLDRTLFVFMWPAVLVSASIGGFGPAALSSILSVLIVDWFLVRPLGFGAADLSPLLMFFLASSLMSVAGSSLRREHTRALRATSDLRDTAMALEQQAMELEQQLEESQSLQEELEQTTSELADRTAQAESSSAFVRGVFESIADPFIVLDADWRFRFVNAVAVRFFAERRQRLEPVMGLSLWEAFPELAGTQIESTIRHAAAERVPVTAEARGVDGTTWSVMSCYPLPDGGLAVQWKDITARHRAEEAAHYLARASEVLGASLDYETTLRHLAHVVVPEFAEWCTVHVLDADGTARQVALAHRDPEKVRWAAELNQRYPTDQSAETGLYKVLRTGRPEILPEITDEMLVAGARDAHHLELLRALELRSALLVPLIAHDKVLGALSLLSVRSGRRYGAEDLVLATELARRAALAVDNALVHQAEARARRIADEANMAKMQFLAVMSHELRTPLNAIGGYAELLQLGLRGPVTDAQKEDLERITRSQRSLLGLINDILNFAKIEAGHIEFTITDLPLEPILADLESVIGPQLRGAKLRIETRCDERVVARADAEKLRQVLLNLLSNAIKFTEPGGTVTLSCERSGDVALVHVADTGIGIAADRLEAVFDPFVQLDRTLSSQHEGTGLGLSISRDLARAMGGEITVRSERGSGSTFTLRLPAASE